MEPRVSEQRLRRDEFNRGSIAVERVDLSILLPRLLGLNGVEPQFELWRYWRVR